MPTYQFDNRPPIITEASPIRAVDFVDGHFDADITRVVTRDDDNALLGKTVWREVLSAHRLTDLIIELATTAGPLRVRAEFLIFGERRPLS